MSGVGVITVDVTVPGPQGPQGIQGPVGPSGPQGPVGPQGPTGTGVWVSDTPPALALVDDLWWDSTGTGLYVRYNDGNSTQWVVAENQNTVPEAPRDGATYGRMNGTWTSALALSGGTITGPLTLAANATQPMHAVPLQQVLPISGGTPTGPVMITATGGTVARSMQNRAADTANVLDYGADPTGATDSSAAFNAAASHINPVTGQRVSVYAPAGKYRINHQVSLANGQSLLGDGPGVTTLYISDQFDPSATSIIVCAGGVIDPGPTISNLMFWFEQPIDQTSRANFKTLANGGTSGNGGTGVQYPWCIATSGNSGRIIIRNVNIDGSWNGIEANHACYWIDGLRICAFNIGISIGGTASAGVLDWSHLSDIEFWDFGLNTAALQNIYMDGNTIGMQIGAQNGLTAQNISLFTARLIFTSDANAGWFSFTNLAMDAGQSTIEVAAAAWLQIANLYTTSGANALRPIIGIAGGNVMINNWYGHNSSPHEMLQVTGGDVTVVGAHLTPYDMTADVINVSNGGTTLRLNDIKLYMTGTVAWGRPVIEQYGASVLQVDNLDLIGTATSGTAIQFNSDQIGNYCGNVAVASGWSRVWGALGPNGNYGEMAVFSAPSDGSSIQAGSYGFTRFGATGHHSTGFGNLCLDQHLDGGSDNTAMGWLAGYNCSIGTFNCFFGSAAGYGASGNISGSNNTAYGANSARNLTTGNQNIFVGAFAGQSITTGSGNILIGFGEDAAAATSNYLNIGGVISSSGINAPATSVTAVAGKVWLPALQTSTTYANDAAAAAGGVSIGQLYRNGSVVQVRVA